MTYILTERNLIRILNWLMAIILMTPVIAWRGFSLDYTLARTLIFFVLIELAFIVYLLLIIKNPKFLPQFSWLLFFVVAFFFVNLISLMLSLDISRSFFGTWERSMDSGFLAQIHYFLFFIIFSALLKDSQNRDRFLKVSLFAAFIVSLIGLGEVFEFLISNQPIERVKASLANPIVLSVYLGFNIFFALYLLSREAQRNLKIFYGAVAGLSLLAIFFASARAATAALIISFLVLFLFWRQPQRRYIWGILGLIILTIITLVILKSAGVFLGEATEHLINFSWRDPSLINRLHTWQVALSGIKERPILGWGQENFFHLFNKYYDPAFLEQPDSETWWDRAHNLYIDVLAVSGFLGFLAFAGFLATGLIHSWRQSLFFFAALIFYIIAGLFFFDTLPTYLMLFFTLILLHSGAVQNKLAGVNSIRKVKLETITAALLIFGTLILIIVFYQYSKIALANNYQNQAGAISVYSETYSKAVDSFQKSLNFETAFNGEIAYELAKWIGEARIGEVYESKVISMERARQDFELVKKYIETAVSEHPADAKLLYMASRLNNIYFNYDNNLDLAKAAEKYAQQGLKSSPLRQQIYLELAQAKKSQGDLAETEKILQKVIELNPEFSGGYFALALFNFSIGKEEEGMKLVDKARQLGFEKHTVSSQALLYTAAVYYKYKKYDEMIEIYKTLIRLSPTNEKYRRFLATTYLEAGYYEEAKKEAAEILRLNPSAEKDVEIFLNELKRRQKSQSF